MRSLVKIKSIPDWHLFISRMQSSKLGCFRHVRNSNITKALVVIRGLPNEPNGNEKDQMVRNEIACNCILIVRIAFRYAHISF